MSLLSVKKKGGGGQRFWTRKDQQRWSLVVNEFDLMKDFTVIPEKCVDFLTPSEIQNEEGDKKGTKIEPFHGILQ